MKRQPNIVLVLSDDQGPWAMGCAGNREISTPNLDRLAAAGMRFENFFCASPVCSPARATLLTGRIPSRHGVHDWLAAGNTTAKYEPAGNGRLIEYLRGIPGYTDHLAAAGYRCGLSGKWHLGDCHHPQKSFEFWEVHAKGGGPYYNAPMIRDGAVYEEPRYVTDAITDNALRWMATRKGSDRPFYLGVHYTAPHSPWERRHHPAELYDMYHGDCAFESVPDGLTPPEWVTRLGIPVESPARRRELLSGYFAAVTAMDRNIGRLLDWLEKNGMRHDTLVVFTGDNGMNMGHHGVFGKGNATFPLHRYPYGPNELYDLRNDPAEKSNLAGKAGLAATERQMRGLLVEWFALHADPDRDGSREPVTGLGQLGLCGRPGRGEENFAPLPAPAGN
jgi:arylsulfatase A-like enzyme